MTDPTNDQGIPPVPPPYTAPAQPPAYTAPTAGQPAPAQPASAPPAYGAPAYGQPAAGQSDAAQPGYAPAYGGTTATPTKTLSLIGMIAGIVGVVAFGYFLPASIAALVLGYMGKKREGMPARGFWLTAIITGWVGVAITVIGGIALIAIFALASSGSGSY